MFIVFRYTNLNKNSIPCRIQVAVTTKINGNTLKIIYSQIATTKELLFHTMHGLKVLYKV